MILTFRFSHIRVTMTQERHRRKASTCGKVSREQPYKGGERGGIANKKRFFLPSERLFHCAEETLREHGKASFAMPKSLFRKAAKYVPRISRAQSAGHQRLA